MKGSSPEVDPYHLPQEELRTVELNRTVAICTSPVTMAQFNQYANIANSPIYEGFEMDAPICHVNWYNAAAYCNWLSKVEGFPPGEWCYLPNEQQAYAAGMRVAPNSFQRKGYRLLTEPEWEFACRAGEPPVVNRFYGNADELLGEYAWYKGSDVAEKPKGVGLLKPNQIGLFDMLGNVHEWTNTHRFKEQTPEVRNGMDMLMRGGSYGTELKYVRNACPYFEAAHVVSNLYGFRIARTL
jgi:formylglycine-generating enzyme required for sulfatase activity